MRVRSAFLALLFVSGCTGSSSPATPTAAREPARSTLNTTVNPNPVMVSNSGATFFPGATFTVTVMESAGLACNINRVSMAFPLSSLQYDVADIQRLAGGNFVPANGSLKIPFSIVYGGIRPTNFQISVEAIDGKGNTVGSVIDVSII